MCQYCAQISHSGEYQLFPIGMYGADKKRCGGVGLLTVQSGEESLFHAEHPFHRGMRRPVWTNWMQCRCSSGSLKKGASPRSPGSVELVNRLSANRSQPLKMNSAPN